MLIYFPGERFSHESSIHHLTLYNCPVCWHTKRPFRTIDGLRQHAKKSHNLSLVMLFPNGRVLDLKNQFYRVIQKLCNVCTNRRIFGHTKSPYLHTKDRINVLPTRRISKRGKRIFPPRRLRKMMSMTTTAAD